MQVYHRSGDILEAPSPIIPRYRASSQQSKRSYAMSALAPKYQKYLAITDDIHFTETTSVHPNTDKVPEIFGILQAQLSSQGASPPVGPKDMIKAGQRRLKLAFGNKKAAQSKAKADDAARQLAALQNPESPPKTSSSRWGHERSAASTESSPGSVSNLSSKASSKRDVESIGRPWLDHPLDSTDETGSKASSTLSSLDLRDLASYVEAAVNFSETGDSEPPPYQPLTKEDAKQTAVSRSSEYSVCTDAQHGSISKPLRPPADEMRPATGNKSHNASRSNGSACRPNSTLNVSFNHLMVHVHIH